MHYTKISSLETQAISSVLKTLVAKPLSELSMSDFIDWLRTDHRHGYYFFYAESRLMYIGTCRSRSVVSRLMSHVDASEDAWMNTLVSRVAQAKECTYAEAASEIAASFSIKVVFTDTFPPRKSCRDEALDILNENVTKLLRTENDLRATLLPALNPKKTLQAVNTYIYNDAKESKVMKPIMSRMEHIENDDINESNVLMVNVTSWDDGDSQEAQKEKARQKWKVSSKRMQHIQYLAAWNYDSVKAVWAIDDRMLDRETMRYSFVLGENVTKDFAAKIKAELPEDHRMYGVIQYFNL